MPALQETSKIGSFPRSQPFNRDWESSKGTAVITKNPLASNSTAAKIPRFRKFQCRELKLFGPYFISSAVCHLPSDLRERSVHEVWLHFFAVLTDLLARGFPEVQYELEPEEKALIRSTFATVKREMAEVGEATFLKLFSTYSTSKMYLPHRTSAADELALIQALDNHGMLLIKVHTLKF